MMRSLYAGVSGLQNHQLRADVIGNNISNINTNGFKKGRVNFQDIISQTIQGAARPTNEKGGVNPKQVGLGMTVASVDTLMQQGSLQMTGKITDLAVQGEGFFVLRKGDKTMYSRAGNYSLDRERNLVNSANGLKAQGWNATQDTEGNFKVDNSSSYQDVKIPIGAKYEARETTKVKLKCNLDSRVSKVQNPQAPTDIEKRQGRVHSTSIDVYDSQGKVHKLSVQFVKTGINQWQAEVNVSDAVEGSVRFDVKPTGNVDMSDNRVTLTFDEKGALRSVGEEGEKHPDKNARGHLTASVIFNVQDGTSYPEGTRAGQQLGKPQKVEIDLGSVGNFNGVTQLGSTSTTKAVSQDGYGLGYLESYSIDQSGIVRASFTNGQVREIAQVALATFVNPGGLEKAGENSYVITSNSGIANVGPADSQGKGKIISGALEMSNVDLAEEFTNMIVTQRGFQANSRIITTSDQMLQELLTLKR